ncbi:hypothetical protein [Methylibium petroleiphilum]|uniref:Uncharacterized protein n=1 Tax=Methylibium petroleiphilum (strain ATCC BAA-1232 / LMG 22953 / PM1) TaxID=420662 RepID=A2SD69_METPP|nr:hypothetical protein [Methylibium petroleiphilum]ABM93508.1 hypothetical protein Mpe_A0546 [Methylibium petroleiphilum PM1]
MTKPQPAPTLATWAEEHRSSAPAAWISIADRLLSDESAKQAWSQLRRFGDIQMAVFSDICHAVERASNETRRKPTLVERKEVERVKDLALRLKQAIKLSSLPPGTATLYQLNSNCEPPAQLWIGWRDLPTEGVGLGFGYSMSISEMLDRTVELADKHLVSLGPRAVTRQKSRPKVAAFVRWLCFNFVRRFDSELPLVAARFTNAVLRPVDQLTKDDVAAILKDSPLERRSKPKKKKQAS